MIGRILKKDFLRNKVITITLFVFIMLAALLVASAAGMITELLGSVDSLFIRSGAPHFVQMHVGEIDQPAIDSFASKNREIVKGQQTVELLGINGSDIILGNNETSEAGSVMENAFVKQNDSFDFLLDTDNQILRLSDGEIAVPLYHMQQYDLQIGDTVKIVSGGFSMEFTITAFIRDAQMNPSIVTSKRFLVSDNDWKTLKANIGETEYLIEFQLYDINQTGELENLYQNTALPQKGTAITYSLLKLMNSLTDGIVAAVIILLAILLILIAALCLRFTMLATIEEDYREIGVMKAIGIHSRDIRRLYLTKYVCLAAAACGCGYVLSLFVGGLFTGNITLYMGGAKKTLWSALLPFVGAGLVFAAVAAFCRLILRKFRRISAVEALRSGRSNDNGKLARGLKLRSSSFPNVNVFLGIREVLGRFKIYGLLCFVFIVCAFLMIVPLNFLNTVESPEFISYMGAGRSDIRIDLQQTEDIEKRYGDMVQTIQNDPDVIKYSALVTSSFKVLNNDGEYENIKVEIGDFSIFPLEYTNGSAPKQENQIALSSLNAAELNKSVGDTLNLVVNGEERKLAVCGIYQDVTNGGKTAKAVLPYAADNILWYTVNLDVKAETDMTVKIDEYGAAFYPAKITDMENYVSQTLGGIIGQLRLAVKFALLLAVAIAVLITAMFFKMLMAKDAAGISIMRSIGFSYGNIRTQYITRALSVLLIGVIVGTVAAVTLGPGLAGALLTGASRISFVGNPLVSYVLCPGSLIAAVTITMMISCVTMKKTSSLIMTAE